MTADDHAELAAAAIDRILDALSEADQHLRAMVWNERADQWIRDLSAVRAHLAGVPCRGMFEAWKATSAT